MVHGAEGGGRHRTLPAVALVAGLGFGMSASAECPPLPADLLVQPGHTLRLGDRSFELAARLSTPVPDSGREFEVQPLEIDLLARRVDEQTGQSFVGSYQPQLEVTYELARATTTLASGSLMFRASAHGPSYGGTILFGSPPDDGLRLDVTVSTDIPQSPGNCPRFPLEISFDLPLQALMPQPVPTASTDDRNFTVLSNTDPVTEPITAPYNDVWGYSNGTTYVAMIGSIAGTHFIDVTVPDAPVVAAFLPHVASSWRDYKTYENYIYIVSEGVGPGNGMQIVDMTNPLSPVLLSTYTSTFVTCHNLWIDVANGHAWAIGTNNATRILDLATDPENPIDIASRGVFYIHDAYIADGYAYFSEINQGRHRIMDSTNVNSLVDLSVWTTPGHKTHNSWANDTHTLLATTDEVGGGHVAVYDISNKNSPFLVSEYNPDPASIVHNVMFDDDDSYHLAIAYYALGGKYIDLYRPTMPVELASYDTYPNGDVNGNGVWGIYAFDPRGYIYLSDRSTGLYVLEYTPGGGTLSGIVTDMVSGNPIPDARVQVLTGGNEVLTTPQGVYAVYAEGDPLLRVSAYGYGTGFLEPGTVPVAGRLDFDLTLERLPRVTLSGSVLRAGTLAPIAGATVALPGSGMSTTTDGAGGYTLTDVSIGQQTVTADAFGYASQEGRVVLMAGQPGSLDLVLDPGLFIDDAETDLGWTLGVAGDTATGGVWERVDPNGTGGGNVQPEDDHTAAPGTTAFITGQSAPGATVEDNDVTDGLTTLLSPTIDASSLGAARLRYHSWVSENAGTLPGGSLQIDASANNGGSWTNVEDRSASTGSWQRSDFDLGGLVGLTNQVRLRFIASPIYPDSLQVLEAGVDDIDIVSGCVARFSPNLADTDDDGIVDDCDACPLDVGNDSDGDGFCGDSDNAPFVPNDQTDSDGDGVGDAIDNCTGTANAQQRDLDGDGTGDACDPDLDGDGTANGPDTDQDDDGVNDGSDICPTVPDPDQADFDVDSVGDECDPDDGLVRNLLLDGDRIRWEVEPGADDYNVYRGDLGSPGLLRFAACRISGVTTEYFIDLELPLPGEGFFYLVNATVGGLPGRLGFKSNGVSRTVNDPCP